MRRLRPRLFATATSHSLKRKQALAFAHPVDNAGALTCSVDPSFELSNTIFSSLPRGSVLEKVQTEAVERPRLRERSLTFTFPECR